MPLSLPPGLKIEPPDDEILGFLEEYELGTPGHLQYRHTGIPGKLEQMLPMPFLVLRRRGRIIGVIGFSARKVSYPGGQATAYYVRYFMMDAAFRVKKRGGEARSAWDGRSSGIYRDAIYHLLDNPGEMLGEEAAAFHGPGFSLAFIEKENARSSGFAGIMGFTAVRELTTLLFNRFFPRIHPAVGQAGESELEWIRGRTDAYYRDYNCYSSRNLFFKSQYYVYREEGRIIAGLQANPEKWIIRHMPGFTGYLFTRLFPKLPVLRRLVGKKSLRFLALEGLWAETGRESVLPDILETVMARNGIHLAIWWADAASPVFRLVKGIGKRGLIGGNFPEVKGNVVIRPAAGEIHDVDTLRKHPVYISCLDMS